MMTNMVPKRRRMPSFILINCQVHKRCSWCWETEANVDGEFCTTVFIVPDHALLVLWSLRGKKTLFYSCVYVSVYVGFTLMDSHVQQKAVMRCCVQGQAGGPVEVRRPRHWSAPRHTSESHRGSVSVWPRSSFFCTPWLCRGCWTL